jgi:hypothetical protein
MISSGFIIRKLICSLEYAGMRNCVMRHSWEIPNCPNVHFFMCIFETQVDAVLDETGTIKCELLSIPHTSALTSAHWKNLDSSTEYGACK